MSNAVNSFFMSIAVIVTHQRIDIQLVGCHVLEHLVNTCALRDALVIGDVKTAPERMQE